jgi:hypothetical protein
MRFKRKEGKEGKEGKKEKKPESFSLTLGWEVSFFPFKR